MHEFRRLPGLSSFSLFPFVPLFYVHPSFIHLRKRVAMTNFPRPDATTSRMKSNARPSHAPQTYVSCMCVPHFYHRSSSGNDGLGPGARVRASSCARAHAPTGMAVTVIDEEKERRIIATSSKTGVLDYVRWRCNPTSAP